MENRLDRNLVRHLQPGLADQIRPGTGVGRPEGFRKAVAPVYLRRNQKDVLTELPELVIMDEWTEFSTADWEHYRQAVERGAFMAMRSAAYGDAAVTSPNPHHRPWMSPRPSWHARSSKRNSCAWQSSATPR
jgi:hypothetical protein